MPKVQNQTVEREKVSGIKNRTVFIADNLEIMRGMEDESVDLIYLDPPFNSKHNYAAPIGSKAAGVEFKDTWTLNDIDQAWWGEIADQNESLYAIIGTAGKIGGKSSNPRCASKRLSRHHLTPMCYGRLRPQMSCVGNASGPVQLQVGRPVF